MIPVWMCHCRRSHQLCHAGCCPSSHGHSGAETLTEADMVCGHTCVLRGCRPGPPARRSVAPGIDRTGGIDMKYGIVTSYGTIHDYVEMARQAEEHGWDGIFVWDDICIGPTEVFDPWVALGAIAMVTERIALGAMVFSLARRRPWKVARETLTL